MDRDEVEVHKLAKKERGQYPAILNEKKEREFYYMASSVSEQDEPNRAL